MKNKIALGAIIMATTLITCTLVSKYLNKPDKPKSKQENTTLKITNQSQDSVLVFLTLSGYDTTQAKNYVQNVYGIFGIIDSGLVGSFYLQPNDTLSYTSDKMLSGNIGFGSQGINCPNKIWKTGVNIFEFNLNEEQESLDISCMGGVNSIMSIKLIGGPEWQASPSFPNVRYIQNDTMYANTNIVGVYPFGCPNCTNTQGRQPCEQKAETPDSAAICNPTRAAKVRGGTVMLIFNKYTGWQICVK